MRLLLIVLFLVLPSYKMATAETSETTRTLEVLPIQHQGRVMPWSTYARRVAVQLTGRTKWSESRGPESFAGRDAVLLLGDLMFRANELAESPLIKIDRRPLKEKVGLDVERRFFSPAELLAANGLAAIAEDFRVRRQADSEARPTPDEQAALDIQESLGLFQMFAAESPLAIVPAGEGDSFLRASARTCDPGAERVQALLQALKSAWGTPLENEAAASLALALQSAPAYADDIQARVAREVFYNNHHPWRWAAIASGFSILAIGLGWLTRLKAAYFIAGLLIAWAVIEQLLGLFLRISILDRAPVSNTYEVLLWIGLVATGIGLAAQLFNRRSWYLAGGMTAALIAILFAMLVPLEDQTNTLPAVLRSNYWLILHVLTIVASYGALLVSAVLGHVFLARCLLTKRNTPNTPRPESQLTVQIYRVMQIGLVLLTIGTILGGVWAADSWGRFWGWDPKETWSLISIIVYFALIHARYVGWLRDVGLAVASIIGFMAIVWTFYGVNYVMAAGMHSYGFGSGGEIYVAGWVALELVFITICCLRARTTSHKKPGPTPPAHSSSALAAE